MRASAARLLISLLLCVAGCGAETPTEATQNSNATELSSNGEKGTGSPTLSNASFDVNLGTGRNTYMPLVNGDTLHLELGHQGLQHVLVSIRLMGLPKARYSVDFLLVRDDGVNVTEPVRVRLPFNSMSDGMGVQLLGYTLVIVEPALGVGHDAVLRVAVEGPEGEIAVDERSVRVEWASDGWNPDA